jgi:hypothetical protein
LWLDIEIGIRKLGSLNVAKGGTKIPYYRRRKDMWIRLAA